MDPQFKKAWALIKENQNIFLTTHESTDGDDLGSLLAIKHVLDRMGKKVTAAVKKGVPSTLKFLPDSNKVADKFTPGEYDLLIIFGCTNIRRPGFDELMGLNAKILNIDHHPDNGNFGTVNLVDPDTAAVAELVYYFFKSNKTKIDHNIATCLLTGIFTDTGGFKHANTTAEVLEVASILMKCGARIDKIASQTYGQKRPQALKAWSRGLENTRFDPDGKMIFSVLTQEDLDELGATDEDLKGFVELLNNVPQAKFAMLLTQDGETVKGSLRSEPHKGADVSAIAHSFGGGGHKLAAGFKVKGKLTRKDKTWEIK
jgi:phosphoesterase RecJ-like protein